MGQPQPFMAGPLVFVGQVLVEHWFGVRHFNFLWVLKGCLFEKTQHFLSLLFLAQHPGQPPGATEAPSVGRAGVWLLGLHQRQGSLQRLAKRRKVVAI